MEYREKKKRSESCRILDKRWIYRSPRNGAGYETISEGDVAIVRLEWHGDAYAGCFFQLQPRNEYLRRPISLCGNGDGYIDLAIRAAGSGTIELLSRGVGDCMDCFGPLGHGYELPLVNESKDGEKKRYLLVGGGIGVAPLLPVYEYLTKVVDADVDFIVGFRDEPYLHEYANYICSDLGVFENSLCTEEKNESEANLCAENGPEAHGKEAYREIFRLHGHVGRALDDLLPNRTYDDIYACGPKPMLDAVARSASEKGYDPQLLTEEHFGCGVGACLVCTCEVHADQRYARVCADGPMFRASELVQKGEEWRPNEAVNARLRQSSYQPSSCKLDDSHYEREETNDVDLSVDLGGLKLKSLLTTASGTFGFGKEYNQFFDVSILGGVSVKGLTLELKQGNPGRRIAELPSGMMNSVGLQNPGVRYFIEKEMDFLRSRNVAILANVNGCDIDEMVRISQIVSDAEVDAVELNISCPNVAAGGIAFGSDPVVVREVVSKVRQVVEVPLIVKLTPNVTDIAAIAKICAEEGADAVSLINTVTGYALSVAEKKPQLMRGIGGMSGPAVKAVALKCVRQVSDSVSIPILGMGGISSAKDVVEFLMAGATTVAIGTAIFRDPLLPVKIDRDLRAWMKKQGIYNVRDIKRI